MKNGRSKPNSPLDSNRITEMITSDSHDFKFANNKSFNFRSIIFTECTLPNNFLLLFGLASHFCPSYYNCPNHHIPVSSMEGRVSAILYCLAMFLSQFTYYYADLRAPWRAGSSGPLCYSPQLSMLDQVRQAEGHGHVHVRGGGKERVWEGVNEESFINLRIIMMINTYSTT